MGKIRRTSMSRVYVPFCPRPWCGKIDSDIVIVFAIFYTCAGDAFISSFVTVLRHQAYGVCYTPVFPKYNNQNTVIGIPAQEIAYYIIGLSNSPKSFILSLEMCAYSSYTQYQH